jgi:choline-sulfatase
MRGAWIARAAARFLEEHRAAPFALWVSFQEPHSPFDFPLEDRGAFKAADFVPPPIGPEDGPQIPNIFRALSPAERAGIAASYYTSASYLDRNVGRVLRKLDELGLAANTLVVYTADHGYCLGHHGRFEKHCGYDPALRVPLLVRHPGAIAPRVVNSFTEHIDVAPSILEWMGLDPLSHGQGRSLAPYWRGRKPDRVRGHIVSEYLENEDVYVRDARWKLTFSTGRRARQDGYITDNPTPGRTVKLYDLRRDPGEFTDVSRAHPKEVRRLAALALERFRSTHPDAAAEPRAATIEEALEFYLRPRDLSGTASERTR